MTTTTADYHTEETPGPGPAFAELAADLHRRARQLLAVGEPAAAAHLAYLAGRALDQLQAALRGAP